MRRLNEMYPRYTAEIKYIDKNGITPEILYKIIRKHRGNRQYNYKLYERYSNSENGVPIFKRKPRFDSSNPINNKVNNDFFSEITDIKTGYFAGVPVAYGYSITEEATEEVGGEVAIDEATKAITDFITRNNMYDKDMEITKLAAICGYAGRLFYIDKEGQERCMCVLPFETIILALANDEISEPAYALRYYKETDIDGKTSWVVEFYDDKYIYYYEGQLGDLRPAKEQQLHMFDYCPLQGIANNSELQGDAEKVLELIDAYDRTLSDSNNDVEAFANAYMVFKNVLVTEDDVKDAQSSGIIQYDTGTLVNGEVSFLTKPPNDTQSENHLNRIEDNIYRFSKTPNLTDETFGSSTGVALKFKLTPLETKCGMFEAKMRSAGMYMFKVLASSLAKRRIAVNYIQCVMEFSRNFPLDLLTEAQALATFMSTGAISKRTALGQMSFIDDVDYELQLIEAEKDDVDDLFSKDVPDDNTELNLDLDDDMTGGE